MFETVPSFDEESYDSGFTDGYDTGYETGYEESSVP